MSGNELDADDDRHNEPGTTTSDDRDGRGYASSDDDIEIKHENVNNYWLVSGDETPVSFSVLPYSFEDDEKVVPGMEIYLRGTSDNGMCLYVRALSWKLELSGEMKPTFHLRTEKYWIKLLKPRKSYEETIRSILSVSHFLNYALVNPEDSEIAAWDHVKDLFPSWAVEPSRKDLPLHLPIIQHLISSNGRLVTSMALQTIDLGLSRKALVFAGTEDGQQSNRKRMYVSDGEDNEAELDHKDKRSKLEVGLGSDEEMNGFGEDADDDVGDLFETVCCICDNGGEVTGCDGPCMRSFHVHKNAQGADDVNCSTLGFSKSKLERMDKFYCPNCEAKEHQCYACGELGCSDETTGAMQEVFVCDAAMCGHFYHPMCAAELILRDSDKIEQTALAQMIKEGKGFVCPMHKCWKCGKGEVKEERDLQFGICRRCPRVWHRKCFPASILFDEEGDDEPRGEDQITRAWDGLLLNRILIYCKRHPIISKLGTPARTQVKFPTSYMCTARKTSENNKLEQMEKEAKWNKVESFKKRNKDVLNQIVEKKVAMASEADAIHKKTAAASSGPISIKKKLDGAMPSGRPPVFVLRKLDSSIKHDGKTTESCENVVEYEKCDPDGLSRQEKVSGTGLKLKPAVNTSLQQPLQKSKSSLGKSSIVSNETRRMVDSIIQRAKARVTLESVLKKHEVPMNYRGANPKNAYRKHSLVRIESIIKGMQKAVETLENGGSIEEAKMKCSPHLVKYLEICRNDLRVYLSPFLYGARYTSYGRHFTKTEKLEQVADRLHWYMNEGDMVVDFCCGANEFSLLMKEKIDEFGKQCNYKNFDAIQTNNDFHFTKRDWFKVKQEDLPDGSRLIMGLNPPFGVKAALANQFIDHALKFKPKLVVLIVPKETERLDRKREKYDLIWEDPDLLEGKSFYLPGSVDVDENPLNDWNAVAPPLYLWSRSDWTSRHKQIALEKGHISTETSTQFLGTPWIPRQEPRDTLLVPASNSDIDKKNSSTNVRRKVAECVSNEMEALPTEPTVVGTVTSSNGNNLTKLASRNRTNKHSSSKPSIGIANAKNVIPNTSNDNGNDRHLPLNTSDGIAVDSHLLPNISNSIAKDHIQKPKPTIVNKSPSWDGAEKLLMSERPFKKGSATVQRIAIENDLSKVEKKRESPKEKVLEGKDQPCKREMADKGRQSLEWKPDTSWKGKTNDRYDSDGQRSKSSEKHRLINESESSGRKSSGVKWSSVHDTLDRYESSRKWSPIRSDRRSIEFDGHRKISPDRHRHSTSSVVDLDIYSSKGVNKDQDRNYGKTGVSRYQDCRQASPGRRYQEAHSTNYLDHNARRQDAYNLDGQRRVYEDPSRDSMVKNDVINLRESYGNEYGQTTSGQFDKLSYGRRGRANADNYQTVLDGGMLAYGPQADRYRTYDLASIRTETNPFPSSAGRVALPQQNHLIPRYSSASPSLNYVPHQLQQQDHVVDPALLSSHRLFDNRLERAQQASLPQYPPVQGRFGGWIED